jgi:flavodoxin
MFRAAVIYAPAALQAMAERIADSLDRQRFRVLVKPADQASIPDLAAADLVLLGSSAQGRAALPAEFAEIVRALSGIDLGGRVAGVFAAGSDAPLAAWKKALKDSGIRLEENLLRSDGADSKTLSGWVAGLTRQVEEQASRLGR